MLHERLGVPHISSGDLLRDAVARQTELGMKAKQYMDAGRLVPDELVLDMMRERLAAADCGGGFLLDGFPRNVAQAQALTTMLADDGWSLDHVVSLAVDDDEIIQRLQGRREQEGRSDDDEDTVRARLSVYTDETSPLLSFYRSASVLREVEGVGTPEEIFGRILTVVGAAP